MEEQSERKAATAVAEEPIKAEGTVETPDTSERSDGAVSPPPNCSICLGKLINTSFTDSCLHQFCFTCLLQWSKIKTECPLCKQTFKSIIHNVRSEEDYDQYHVPRELASQVATGTLDVNYDIVGNVGTVSVGHIGSNWDLGLRRFMYRSTLGNPSRRLGVILNPHEVAGREQLPSIAPQLTRDELRRRQINPSDFRRNVYRLRVRANPLPDVFGRYRECSPELYRRHPAEINRLIPWLNRELQVLLNNNSPHVAYVLRIITDALSRYSIGSPDFRNLIRPYFGVHTEHFTHELANFARTSFDMVGYDQSVVYLRNRGEYLNEYGPRILSPGSSSSSLTSDDSDVRVVDDTVDRRGISLRFSTLIPNALDMPGPSTIGRAFHPYVPTTTVPDIVVLSSSSSSSDDECEVIGYVKPRHERTPEIIDLSNSEAEATSAQPLLENEPLPPPIVIEDCQPSTSQDVKRHAVRKVDSSFPIQMMEILSSPTYSEISDSDSDYCPKRKHKVTSKKSKKSSQNLQAKKRKRSAPRKNTKTSRALPLNTSFSSSSDSDSKRSKRAPKKDSKRRRISISSGTNSEKSKKKTSKNKSKKRELSGSTSDTPCFESSDSDAESEPRNKRKSRRSYSSSSNTSTTRSVSSSKSIEKSRETRRVSSKVTTSNSRLKKSEEQSESDTCSECEETDKLKLPQYNSCENDTKKVQSKSDLRNSLSETTTTESEEKAAGYEETSTDCSVNDLEQHRYYRSRSQCSVCSDNTRSSKKKSKHKEKRSHKSVKSSTRLYNSSEGTSMSSLNDDEPSTSKHSDSKSSSSRSRSRNKHKSHRKNKTSKRRKSHSNSRTKSKKKTSHSLTIDFQP